jgi:predicted nucleic acid-binding protein
LIAVDSSTFRRFLDGKEGGDVARLELALHKKDVYLPPPSLAELLSEPELGADSRSTVLRMPLLALHPGYWQRTGELRAQLLRMGRKAKLADCLIAQSCIDNDAPLITYDRDFRHFESAGLKLL